MKLVIFTQHMENYGAHDWNGKGQCPNFWKAKGGDVYVVEDIKESHMTKINMDGFPVLTSLITHANNYSTESIAHWDFMGDNEKVCEDWESPTIMTFNRDLEAWVARKISNIEYMRDIDRKIETWTMLPAGGRTDYTCEYRAIADGNWYSDEEIMEMRKAA